MPVPTRPDLANVDPTARAYIEYLETEIERLEEALATAERESAPQGVRVREGGARPRAERAPRSNGAEREMIAAEYAEPSEPAEPPTTRNLITVSGMGVAKRTPRHLYPRQRRGGMGIFDLETPESDPPAFLTVADEAGHLIVVSTQGRAFRFPVRDLPESPVRAKGISLAQKLNLLADERIGIIFPQPADGYQVIVTQRGQVRRVRYHYFGDNLLPGTLLYDIREGGAPAASCWSPGEQELFIATRQGLAIRFAERQVPVRGILGIRIDPGDLVAGVAAVSPDGGVFLVGSEGKGTIREMSTFAANKAPGSGGKAVLKTERLVGAAGPSAQEDLFIISRLGKIIRFRADEVPPKEGPVQGVICMTLRADETMALTASGG